MRRKKDTEKNNKQSRKVGEEEQEKKMHKNNISVHGDKLEQYHPFISYDISPSLFRQAHEGIQSHNAGTQEGRQYHRDGS